MKNKLALYISESHIIVEGIQLHVLNNGGNETIDVSKTGFMRFEVTGTNSDTGLRQSFIFALTCGLTVAQRGVLDLVYIYKLVDETVESILTDNGCFITGNKPHGLQFERMFERTILNPSNVVSNVNTKIRLIYEGRQSVKDIQECGGLDAIKSSLSDRTFLLSDGVSVFPLTADKTPKWGRDDLDVNNDKLLLSEDIIADIVEFYQTSRILPASRQPLEAIYRFSGNGFTVVKPSLRVVSSQTTDFAKPAKAEPKQKNTREYADALDQLSQVMSRSNATRSPYHLGRANQK